MTRFAGMLAIFLLCLSCGFRADDSAVLAELSDKGARGSIEYRLADGVRIRSVRVAAQPGRGESQARGILFIHGAPGSLDAFSDYLADPRLTRSTRVAYDRPGYGYSDFGNAVTSQERQALLAAPLLASLQEAGPAVVLGHSYGGTVAARLAMDFPELVGGLVLVAASVDPEHERIFWFNAPAEWPVLQWAIPQAWRVANDEKLTRVAELRRMLPLWQRIDVPVIVFHGTDDDLVPIEHADFLRRSLDPSPRMEIFQGGGHFILWEQREAIIDALVGLAGAGAAGVQSFP